MQPKAPRRRLSSLLGRECTRRIGEGHRQSIKSRCDAPGGISMMPGQARLGWFTHGHYLDLYYQQKQEELLAEIVHRLIAIEKRLKALEGALE